MRTVKNSPQLANNSTDDPDDPPSLAIRSDGKILVSIIDLAHTDLTGRELWTGLVLTRAEAAAVHRRLNFEEAASPTIGHLRANAPNPKRAKRTAKRG